jgi:ATP-dependent DNA ligase
MEMKKDGNRILIFRQPTGELEVWSRYLRLYPITSGRYQIEKMMGNLPKGSVIEGEWVPKEEVLYLFDTPVLNHLDLTQETCDFRRETVEEVVRTLSNKSVQSVPRAPTQDYAATYQEWRATGDLEGVVLKRRDSVYSKSITETQSKVTTWIKRRFLWDVGRVGGTGQTI